MDRRKQPSALANRNKLFKYLSEYRRVSGKGRKHRNKDGNKMEIRYFTLSSLQDQLSAKESNKNKYIKQILSCKKLGRRLGFECTWPSVISPDEQVGCL